jgi:hypothetical protein
VKAPSYTSLLRTSPGGIVLPLANPLMSNLKDGAGDNTGFFNPELGPLTTSSNPSDGKPVPNLSSPSSSSSTPQPSTPAVPVTPPHQTAAPSTPTHTQPLTPTHAQPPATPTHSQPPATPTHSQPLTPAHAQPPATPNHAQPPSSTPPSTPQSQIISSNLPPLPPLTVSTQTQTTPTTKPLKSPRSMPTSPSVEKEKVIISHSSTKDIDKYNWSANDSLMELLVMGDAFKVQSLLSPFPSSISLLVPSLSLPPFQ